MNRWKENLGTKKRTGDGAARWARRIFCDVYRIWILSERRRTAVDRGWQFPKDVSWKAGKNYTHRVQHASVPRYDF